MENFNLKKLQENLKKNNMTPHLVATKAEALDLVKAMIPKGSSVGVGGSVTLVETGILAWLRQGECNFLDRYKPGLSPEEISEIFRMSAAADFYLCSSNAITEAGELYNVDGNCNRISAISFGPKKVIVVAGVNKIVKDIGAAAKRVKLVAAPQNAKRLGCNTYCAQTGECVCAKTGELEVVGAGCDSEGRICCNYLISAKQRVPDRIHVILVEQELGF